MKAFSKQIEEAYPAMKRRAMKLTNYNEDAADDLVQEAAIKALKNQDKYKEGNFIGWCVTILYRLFLDDLKKNKSALKGFHIVELVEELELIEDDTSNDEDKNQDFQKVNITLEIMDERCRTLLTLFGQGLKYKEIAEKLSMKQGTVMSGLSRCREKFRLLFNETESTI